jgi:hypothetical protein
MMSPESDVGWNTPVRTNSPANDVIRALRAQLSWVEQHKKPDEIVRVLCGGAFGAHYAARILPEGGDFLRIELKKEGGSADWVVAPVAQCSFMFSVAVPRPEAPEEKVILGFAEHESI